MLIFRNSIFILSCVVILCGCNLTTHVVGQGKVSFNSQETSRCDNGDVYCTSWGYGVEVELYATPAEGYRFYGWDGDCQGDQSCIVSMSSARRVQAIFLAENGTPITPEFRPLTDYFFSAPWPNDAYSRGADGSVDLSDFPFEKNSWWATHLKTMAGNTDGFSTNAGAFFQLPIGFHVPLNLSALSAYFINTDEQSDHFGEVLSSDIHFYLEDSEKVGIEKNLLLVVTPKVGYPLRPLTNYTVGVFATGSDFKKPQLLHQLAGEYQSEMAISETLFDTLKQQKQRLNVSMANHPEMTEEKLIAFTSYTTQDPKVIDRAIGNTLNAFTEQQIVDSVVEIEQLSTCSSVDVTENYLLHTKVPNFQEGRRPYLLSGGNIVVEAGRAEIQGYELLELLLKIPCEAPPEQGFPLIVHANGTLFDWTFLEPEKANQNRRSIEVILSAPESDRRKSRLVEQLSDLLVSVGIDEDIIHLGLFGMISDFNVFNLTNAKFGLIQYGAEMNYAQKVALHLDKLFPDHDQVDSAPGQRVLSGLSAGAIAVMHARAMGADADMITTGYSLRSSYLHVDRIVSFQGLPPALVDTISNISGVNIGNNRYQPLMHVLQTSMEAMDTLNYIDEFDVPYLMYGMSRFNDSVHGGESAFSIATAMASQLGVTALREEGVDHGLEEYMDVSDSITYQQYGYENTQRFITVSDNSWWWESPLYRGTKCFPFDMYQRKGEESTPFDGSVNFRDFSRDVNTRLCEYE